MTLLIDGVSYPILQVYDFNIPSYSSSITVEGGGYQENVQRGTGYNKAGKKVSFRVFVKSYQGEVLQTIIDEISKLFIWTPRREYILIREYQGRPYHMRLTAPKYNIPEITNLREISVKVSFLCLDNFFVGEEITIPFSEDIDVVSTVDTQLSLSCTLLMETGLNYPLLVQFREDGGNFVQIQTNIPVEYTGNNILTISNKEASYGDYDLTEFLTGNVKLIFETNTPYEDATITYTGGII